MSRTNRSALPARLPNATKHGAFSKVALFPGEDPRELDRLRSALMDEHKPNGPNEEAEVTIILTCIWRTRRIEMYLASKAAERLNNREQAARLALGALALDPDSTARILRTCAPDIRERIEKKFPRTGYTTDADWQDAVRDHLELALRSELIPPDGETEPEPQSVDEPQPIDWSGLFFPPTRPNSSEKTDEELIELEMKAIERLAAIRVRAFRRLMQFKALKQMMDSPNLHLCAPDIITLPTSSHRKQRNCIDQDDLD